MYGKVNSSCLQGIDGKLIEVELDISNGLPQMTIVGLPDSAIRESIDRVRSAVKNCGFEFPLERITVNLAPADIRKEGSAFDLAIAAGILLTSGQIKMVLSDTLLIGELALDGALRPVPGVLSMVHGAKAQGIAKVIVASENAAEAMLVGGVRVCGLSHLKELKRWKESDCSNLFNGFNNKSHLISPSSDAAAAGSSENASSYEDYADVRGQHQAKRAMMIAAAGLHNVLLIGPPGTGKTMLIRRLPSILTELSDEEAMEVTKIQSAAGKLALDRTGLIRSRPFRSPHHTVSSGGLIGGGPVPKPGEASLAHRGILFLDELPEFSRQALEVLRQPLEDREVTISRTRAVYSFPANFMLAASMNPCSCGYYGAESGGRCCTCSPLKIQHYRSRLSGPLLDRLDLQVDVPRMEFGTLVDDSLPLSSAQMKESVMAAQERQLHRFQGLPFRTNSELAGKWLRLFCRLDAESEAMLMACYQTLGLSIRAHDRILKIARTIADLDGCEQIEKAHLAEAIQYRQLDRI